MSPRERFLILKRSEVSLSSLSFLHQRQSLVRRTGSAQNASTESSLLAALFLVLCHCVCNAATGCPHTLRHVCLEGACTVRHTHIQCATGQATLNVACQFRSVTFRRYRHSSDEVNDINRKLSEAWKCLRRRFRSVDGFAALKFLNLKGSVGAT